jgi:hypothetical protein
MLMILLEGLLNTNNMEILCNVLKIIASLLEENN